MKREKNNLIIRNAIKEAGVRYWNVAEDILHISDNKFSMMLRHELPINEQQEIADKIKALYA